ncbi:MAG TPA: flagellar assembly protein FliH [Rugosibacter sp.]
MTTDTRPVTSLTAWERWELASFDEAEAASSAAENETTLQPSPANTDEINRLHEIARQEGYQKGFDTGYKEGSESGHEAALAEGRQLSNQLTQVLSRLEAGISELEQAVADDLLALSLEIARKVTHQTVAVQPQVILGVIREALAQLPLQHTIIHLNPADVALIDSFNEKQITQTGHRIQEDAQLARGDVVIEAGNTHLDARLATRWQHAIAALGQDLPWLATDRPEHA